MLLLTQIHYPILGRFWQQVPELYIFSSVYMCKKSMSTIKGDHPCKVFSEKKFGTKMSGINAAQYFTKINFF